MKRTMLFLLALVLPLACGGVEDTSQARPGIPFVRDATPSRHVGRVVELLVAGPYAYALVQLAQGERVWTVSLGQGQPVGQPVRVVRFARKLDFHSARLDRSFPELWFATVHAIPQEAP